MRQETVNQQIAVEKYRDQDRTGNRGAEKIPGGRVVDQSKDQRAQIQKDQEDGAGQRKNTFCFFHGNHPLHLN